MPLAHGDAHPPSPPDAQERRLAAGFDQLPQGVLILDAALRVVMRNPAMARMCPPWRDMLAELPARFAAGAAFTHHYAMAEGRTVEAQWQLLPDGSWLGTHQDITASQRSAAQLAHIARHDPLTELLNRAAFVQELAAAIARCRRGSAFAVLAINLDRFKQLNETHGHAAGDALLCEVAARLAGCAGEHDLVARLANDEFAIIQAVADQPGAADGLARRALDALRPPVVVEGVPIEVGACVGIALGGHGVGDPEYLLRNATLALCLAKSENGRLAGDGAYRFFEPDMDSRAKARHTLEADLRRALARNEFELFYQPLVNVGQRRVSAFEALLRWRHPVRGMVPPDAFIPIAEEIGVIVPLGEWVLRTACAEAMRWPDNLRVAVNLSAVQFASPGLADMVERALADTGLPGHRLELEVTETVLLQESDATLAILHRLRRLGARISMDDFGTGYSSLSYLRSFPFDKIKIDKSFISSVTVSEGSDAIVRSIIGLGITLGIATAAEGVETVEQLQHLVADGCTEVQGYFFSPPRPAAEIPSLIQAVRATQAA